MTDKFAELWQRLESYRDEMIAVQRSLCSIPALAPENGGDGEAKKAQWLLDYLKDWPFAFQQLIKAKDDRTSCGYRPNIVAVLPGKNPARTLWLMAHTDVVPPGDLKKWSGDPWTLRVEKDKLIGRGTEDNQQGLVSSLFAARVFVDLGIQPYHNLGLMFVADEETGSKYGVKYLFDHHKALFKPDDLFIIPDAGNADGTMIEIAEKSILWVKFHVTGVQTHASTPELGKNAHKAGAELIYRLDSLYEQFSDRDEVFEPPISTFEPTKKIANVPNVNTIPGEDIFYFDCRILPSYPADEVREAIQTHVRAVEKKHGVMIEIDWVHEERATPPTAAEAPIVKAIAKAMQELRGKTCRPAGIGGGTVAAFFRRAGLPAAVWSTMDEVAHEPDEYCHLQNLVDDAKVFVHVAIHP